MQWMSTKICKMCGVPAIWAGWISVDSDNVTIDLKSKMRAVFYEVTEVQNIFDKIEDTLAIPLEHVFFEAHKEAVRYLFESALTGFLGSVLRKAAPGLVLKRMADVGPLFGVGPFSIIEFRRGRFLSADASRVFNQNLFGSDICGGTEAVCQFEVDREMKTIDGLPAVIARRREAAIEEFAGRFKPITSESIGNLDIPKCYHCGAPISMQMFEWNREAGEIRERDTGVGVMWESHAAVDGLLLEMEKEIGTEIEALVVSIEAEYVRDKILSGVYDAILKDKTESEKIFEHLNLIRRRGFGNPVISDLAGRKLRVTIRNPVNQAVVLGRILGSYEAVTGEKGDYHSRNDEDGLKVVVEPAE